MTMLAATGSWVSWWASAAVLLCLLHAAALRVARRRAEAMAGPRAGEVGEAIRRQRWSVPGWLAYSVAVYLCCEWWQHSPPAGLWRLVASGLAVWALIAPSGCAVAVWSGLNIGLAPLLRPAASDAWWGRALAAWHRESQPSRLLTWSGIILAAGWAIILGFWYVAQRPVR